MHLLASDGHLCNILFRSCLHHCMQPPLTWLVTAKPLGSCSDKRPADWHRLPVRCTPALKLIACVPAASWLAVPLQSLQGTP